MSFRELWGSLFLMWSKQKIYYINTNVLIVSCSYLRIYCNSCFIVWFLFPALVNCVLCPLEAAILYCVDRTCPALPWSPTNTLRQLSIYLTHTFLLFRCHKLKEKHQWFTHSVCAFQGLVVSPCFHPIRRVYVAVQWFLLTKRRL